MRLALLLGFGFACAAARADIVELRPRLVDKGGIAGVEYRSGTALVGRATDTAPAGLELLLPRSAPVPVRFREKADRDGVLELGPAKVGALTLRWRIAQKNPSLVERTLEVTASAPQRFSVTFPLEVALDGELASFSGPEKSPIVYDTGVRERKNQTFPVAMVRTSDRVYGIFADSPGRWENRCQVSLHPEKRRLAILTGDGGGPFTMSIKPPEDARDVYQYRMDGWQSLSAGETRRFRTWVFASPARTHYDAQVAFHLAVANAQGWNSSGLEAILRNTSLYLLRRNLMRDEHDRPRDGKYIFISGMTYGWKQWVSTGIYSALGLDDAEAMIEAYRAVFWHRMDYEENAQYYLIWAALAKRAGGIVNDSLVRQAYEFVRRHEKDGLYIPPPLPGAPRKKGWKSYMDVLEYDDDDAPASNQGFHCGALMAAKELGLPVTEADIERATHAYQHMFNQKLGFMPTSLKRQETLGQDTLYGATLTYAVFGRKLLTDDQVLTHYRMSEKVKSPFGLRVISAADGSLLPGHSGEYCYGGSWFFCDSGNYLLAGVHGLPADEVDARLIERIKLELGSNPAFHEDINTATGQPHGNTPYADYSVYRWLRKETRRRLKQTGPDKVEAAIDAHLGVVRENGVLRLEPEKKMKMDSSSMNSRDLISTTLALVLLAFARPSPAAELPWPCRNGPFQNGCAAEDDARGLPTEWDEASGKNIGWKIELEGFGHSTPVIGHGRLWFTAATEDGKQQFVYAIDAGTGRVVHHKLMFENRAPEPLANNVNTYASPSCVLEDDAVYVHFGSYGTARLNPETAAVVWQRRDLPCRHFRGAGSSPVVWNDLVFLTFDGIDQQYVAALDKHTGKTVWRRDRSTDYHDLGPDGKPKIDGDLRKAYGTPTTMDVAGRTQLISVGSRAAFGYDAATGREIWTVTHDDFNAAAPPLHYDNTAIIASGSGGTDFMAVRLDESTRGDVTKSHLAWNRKKANARLSAPVLDRDRVWFLTDGGVLFGIEAKTGRQLAALRLSRSFVASPVIAGEFLYGCDEDGTAYVIGTSLPPKVVAKNRLSEGMRASPAVAEGALYLRTYHRLYKIAKSP